MAERYYVAVKALIRRKDGHILLVRDPDRGWEFPGGSVERDEDLIAALQREVREEAGVEVEVGELAGVYSGLNRAQMLFFYFHARHVSGVPRPSDETPEVGWYTMQEARMMITMPAVLDRLDEFEGSGGRPMYAATIGGWRGKPYKLLLRRKI